MFHIKGDGDSRVVQLLRRAFEHASERGSRYALNRAIWKLQRAKFEQLRKNLSNQSASQTVIIRYLDREFELHPSLQGLSEELRIFGTHEPLGREAYLQQLSPGDHVLDVGSNIGYWLLAAQQAVGEAGHILGFEPAPEVNSILQRNICRSGCRNISVVPYAVGATNGTAEFYQSEVPNWGSLIKQDGLRQSHPVNVQIRRLEDVLREFPEFHPDALRMDLEGAELMVLESARDILMRYKPCLFVEFHPLILGWPAIRNTLVWLRDLGYSSGTLIERTWDQPWISKWMRERRRWSGSVDFLLRRVEDPKDPLTESTFTIILSSAARQDHYPSGVKES
jgi:FkbM family methyltransferase